MYSTVGWHVDKIFPKNIEFFPLKLFNGQFKGILKFFLTKLNFKGKNQKINFHNFGPCPNSKSI